MILGESGRNDHLGSVVSFGHDPLWLWLWWRVLLTSVLMRRFLSFSFVLYIFCESQYDVCVCVCLYFRVRRCISLVGEESRVVSNGHIV